MLTESGEAIEFDSYMIPESDLEIGQLRLLDVDQRLVVPVDTHVRYIVTLPRIYACGYWRSFCFRLLSMSW